MDLQPLEPAAFRNPALLLCGTVDYDMYASFRQQFARPPGEGLLVVELATLGGDPEVARMMARISASTASLIPAAASPSSERQRSIRPAPRS
jgi:hypothetical protein